MNEMDESTLIDSLLTLAIVIFIFLLGLFVAVQAFDIVHIGMLVVMVIIIAIIAIKAKL